MTGLTPKQKKLYDFLVWYAGEFGCAPTYDEMMRGMVNCSRSEIARLMVQLESRGAIRRTKHRSRAIEIIPQGDAVTLRPEVRDAAVKYARKQHISLSTALAEAASAYFTGDKAA